MNLHKHLDQVRSLCERGEWERVNELIDNKPELTNYVDEHDVGVLHVVASFAGSRSSIEKLILLGADVNQESKEGETPLTVSILAGSYIGLDSLAETRCLLDNGADPNKVGPSGNRPMQWALIHNRIPHLKLLVDYNADPQLKTIDLQPEDSYQIAHEYGIDLRSILAAAHSNQ